MLYPLYLSRDRTYYKTVARQHFVDSLSWDVLGGCQTATISTYGGAAELWNMTGWLRCPVEIVDGQGRKVWWGYVNDVVVNTGVTELGLTLDNMANTVQVAYSFVSPGTNEVGNRKTTTAITNADSITEYGTKEMIVSQSGLTDAVAGDLATRYLSDHKLPQRLFTPGGTGRPYDNMPAPRATFFTVKLNCKGWWSTLGWRYANVTKTGPLFSTAAATLVNLGDNAARTYLMQQFTVGTTGIYAVGASVYIRKAASPTDNLVIGIYTLDGSGNPTGVALASGTKAAAGLGTTGAWERVEFSAPVTLSANVQYGLQLSRSGAVDGTNYMRINTDAGLGYAGGAFKVWSGAAWSAHTTDVDAIFRINVNQLMETTQQVKDLVTTYGQFFTYTDIVTASGVSVGANHDGDGTALDAIVDLLAHGGPNDRRMIATVIPNQSGGVVLSVDEEEASTAYKYFQDSGGRLWTVGGSPVVPYNPPVGRWVKIRDAIPGAGDTGLLADATLQFMEGADWNASSGLSCRYRGQPDITDIGRLMGTGGYG